MALASPPDVQITNLPTDVVSGGTLTMQYKVADTNDGVNVPAAIQVKSDFRCSGQCGQISPVDNDGTTFTARLTAPTVGAGATRNITITITARIGDESATASQTVAVKGPDKPQSVTQISGKVKDQDGKPISGASVAIRDSAGNPYSTTTNGSGGYSFNSSESKPIVPGNISVGALKDGYQTVTVQIQGAAGRSVNVPLTLKLLEATATPSASASATAEASAAVDDASEQPSAEAPAAGPDTKSASDNSSGGGSLLFILLGGLLVAAGVGAIVLVMMRRKNAADDGLGPDDPTVMGGGGGVVPPSQGRFNDATRVAAPMGTGRDATMVAPRAGAGMSDAPTMLQRPVPADDEFPDPYGAPIPQQGGPYRGAAVGGWDDQGDGYGGQPQYGGGNGYAEPTQYGRQQDDDGYGSYGSARGNGYGDGAAQQRYDEPTGMYRPEAEQADGYGYDRGGYGSGQQPPYGAAGGGVGYQAGGSYSAAGYDQGGYDRGGYEQDGGNAYSPQAGGAYSGGAYGGGPQYAGGYDESRDGYGGADQSGGYDPRGGTYGRGGASYDQGQGGYEEPGYGDHGGYGRQQPQRGSGHGAQSRQQEPSQPGQRRSLDWMDN